MSVVYMIGALIVVLGIACAFAAVRFFAKQKRTACIVSSALLVVLIIAFALVPMSFHTVDAGEVAVVKYLG